MSNAVSSQSSVGRAALGATGRAIQAIEGVNAAAIDVDNVAIFAKFTKKAEDTAQASV